MEVYRKKIKTRILIGAGIIFLGIAWITFNRFFGELIGAHEDTIIYVHEATSGLLSGLLALVIIYIIRCQFAIRDDEKLKKLYIKETDERALFIYQKSGSIGMNISVAGLLLGALVCAYINIIVAATLLGACLFISLIRGFLKLYYRKHI